LNRYNFLVSVIIPTYNRRELVARAVKSVINQTYWNTEIIVVDDGSTDNTKNFLQSFFPHIKYIYQENRGVSAARNCGVSVSSGKYIAFLDSDDEWMAEFLDKTVNYMISGDFRIAQADERWIRNGKHLNKMKKHEKFEGDIFIPSLSLCLVTPSAVVMERELFLSYGGFDESLPACEDYDLWLRMGVSEKFGYLREILVTKYGGHEDQLSSTPLLDKYRILSLLKIGSSYISDELKKNAIIEKLIEKIEIFENGAKKRENLAELEWINSVKKEFFS